MANKNDKVEGNADGKWYVDESCIACGICLEFSKKLELDYDIGFCKVTSQPNNAHEETGMEQARDVCPVGAIGDDGD